MKKTNQQTDEILNNNRLHGIFDTVPLLFRKFPPGELRAFLLCGTVSEYEAGEIILAESEEPSKCGLLIADGKVNCFKQDRFLTTLKPGTFLGETFLLKEKPPTTTLVAAENTIMITFGRDAVLSFFENRPERIFKLFLLNLLEVQDQKLEQAEDKILYLQKKLFENKKS